ncbi:putative gustatory receptor 28a [Uranotaenia lowii]|uniref:putative gustatory receptor 28a n=1 Tax=Uranotaenia lowii TaxID=190385 RepID=UPI00247A2B1D|nr:putative gustatory receptor 28a [Uranotaenia lowii]
MIAAAFAAYHQPCDDTKLCSTLEAASVIIQPNSGMAKLTTSKVGDSSQQDQFDFLPLYYMAKFAGLWPQSIRRSSPGISVWSLLYLIVVYSFLGYCIYVNSDPSLWSNLLHQVDSGILRYGLQIHIINGLAMAIIVSVINIFQRHQKWSFLELFQQTTDIVRRDLYVEIPFKFYYGIATAQNVFLLAVTLLYYYLLAVKLRIDSNVLYISYYLINMTSLIFTVEYVAFVVSVKSRMTLVSSLLKQLLFEKSDVEFVELDSKTPTIAYNEIFMIRSNIKDQLKDEKKIVFVDETNETMISSLKSWWKYLNRKQLKVRRLRVDRYSSTSEINEFVDVLSCLHYKSCECVELLNRSFSIQLMLHFATMFLYLVFALFALYKAFNTTSVPFQLLAAANGFWIVYYMTSIMVIISVQSSTVESCHESGDIVHQIIRQNQKTFGTAAIEKLSTFSLQLKMRNISFSCGLFEFDWPLFASMLAAIAMYLVFLIQFDVTPTQTNSNITSAKS